MRPSSPSESSLFTSLGYSLVFSILFFIVESHSDIITINRLCRLPSSNCSVFISSPILYSHTHSSCTVCLSSSMGTSCFTSFFCFAPTYFLRKWLLALEVAINPRDLQYSFGLRWGPKFSKIPCLLFDNSKQHKRRIYYNNGTV